MQGSDRIVDVALEDLNAAFRLSNQILIERCIITLKYETPSSRWKEVLWELRSLWNRYLIPRSIEDAWLDLVLNGPDWGETVTDDVVAKTLPSIKRRVLVRELVLA